MLLALLREEKAENISAARLAALPLFLPLVGALSRWKGRLPTAPGPEFSSRAPLLFLKNTGSDL